MKLIILTILLICSTSYADDMCFDLAGQEFNIAPELLRAISKVESNHKSDAINTNNDKSIDFGHMQINSFWEKYLNGNYYKLIDPCYCTRVGAWILKQNITKYGYNWDAVACYNTGSLNTKKKRKKGRAYVTKVKNALQ